MGGRPIQIASLFASVLFKANNADLMLFSDDAIFMQANPGDSVATIANQISGHMQSGGTNFHAIFTKLIQNQVKYDRIIILSDMQGWVGGYTPAAEFAAYKKLIGSTPVVYSFDLQGLGSMQFPEPSVYCLAGFSEKTMDIMAMLEKDKHALVNAIEAIEL
jgi:hypothetical protein